MSEYQVNVAHYVAKYRYAAACRAWGIVNRLPLEQRSKHYSRICATRNKLRGMV